MCKIICVNYKDARKLAIKEGQKADFGIRKPSAAEYPDHCPFAVEQILDEDFYGD